MWWKVRSKTMIVLEVNEDFVDRSFFIYTGRANNKNVEESSYMRLARKVGKYGIQC